MRILIRTSKWAIWARRFGSLALPLAIIPIFLHRERIISSADFSIIEIVAMSIAALGMFLALGAFVRLWITGDQGWGKATMGFFLSFLCLAPLALSFSLMALYPAVSDVTSDPSNPPGIVSQLPASRLAPVDAAAIEAAFPNARNRTYPIEAAQMFELVATMVDQRGWDTRAQRVPQTPLAEGQINAVATTLLGWREEAAIRIQGDPQGSIVSMRSASLHPGHDLGENGRRIEEFLTALDQRVTLLLREAPVAPVPVDPEAAPEVEGEAEEGGG
jgi:hypothetical protein